MSIILKKQYYVSIPIKQSQMNLIYWLSNRPQCSIARNNPTINDI